MLHTFLTIIHFFCAAGIVSLVLLQRGKGAEAGAGFGAGASGTVFGARGASTALSRATAILAGIFMLTSLSLAYLGTKQSTTSNSLIDRLPATSPSAPPSVPMTGAPAGVTGGAATPVVPATPNGTAAPASAAPAVPAAPAGGSAPK